MVLIFSPVIVVWSLYWIFVNKYKKISSLIPVIKRLFLSALLSLGLAAFFTLPVLFESRLVQIDSMFTNYYTYSIHFASVFQLFISNFWGDGPSVWGTNDGMSFAIGYLQWIIPVILLFFIIFRFFKTRRLTKLETSVVGLISLAFFSAFMSQERSTFIWKLLPLIQKVQFPWRFLNVTTFLFSLSSGFLFLLLNQLKFLKRFKYHLLGLIIVILIAVNLSHFTPITFGPITDQQKFSGKAWTNQVTGGIYDYLPKTASVAPVRPAREYVDEVIPSNTKYILSGQKRGTDWQYFNINLDSPAMVYLSVIAFPQFQLYDHQQPVAYQIEPINGRISVNLAAGQHQIYLKLRNTLIRTVSNYISLISLIIIIYLLLPEKWKKLTLRP